MPVSFDHAQRVPEFLEAAARVRDPNLVAYWKIIMTIQVNLVNPVNNVVRRFAEFTRRRAYDPHYSHFAESVYQWLVFLHRAGLTAEGLAKIGPTKPGMVEKLRRTLASHELGHSRKKTREHHPAGQAYKRVYMTEADFMVGDGVMEVLGYPAGPVLNSEVADIPTSEPDKVQYVDQMVTALKNMVGRDRGMEAQVKQVMATSASVFESLAWRLFIACRQAQLGKPKVSPWATSYYYRKYDNFQSRWDDLIHFVQTNKAAVSNLFLSSYFARFAADPYKERSTKQQNAKTNNDKADKKRAGDEAIATLAGNPLPANITTAGGNQVQPLANSENAEGAAEDFVAAAGAAGAAVQGPRQPQEPVFARPQHINMANDGWIDYTENNFEALYRMHEAQLEAYNAEVKAYNEQKNTAAMDSDSEFEDDDDDLMDNDNFADEDHNGEAPDEPNYRADYNDVFDDIYGMSDDETRERRRQNVSAARAPAAPPNNTGIVPIMADPAMPILASRLPPTQAGPAVESHSYGLSIRRPVLNQIQATHVPQISQPVQSQFSAPRGQGQSPARPLADVVPRRIITPASERARLLRENEKAASTVRPDSPAAFVGYSSPVFPSRPLQQVTPSQAAPQPLRLQPAHGRELEQLINPGQPLAMPVQQATVLEVHQPGEEELMALFEQMTNGQPEAPQQSVFPPADNHVDFDMDQLEDLDMSLDGIMSDEELIAYAATQGYRIDINDLAQLDVAEDNNPENQIMGAGFINEQLVEHPVKENANQLSEQNNDADGDQDLFSQFINLPDNIDNTEDDLFADEYVMHDAIEGFYSQDSTGSIGNKRMRDGNGDEEGSQHPAQRARTH
ncbi:hypothetical protein B0T13DRAFT_395580 [Neurospora crassa]|nr:hypothetical protein B0T13DRAFT_395580 [Neurospora crassa]